MTLSSQQEADFLLGIWQRSRELPPEQRLEKLFLDFFSPLLPCPAEYELQLEAVKNEMESIS